MHATLLLTAVAIGLATVEAQCPVSGEWEAPGPSDGRATTSTI